MTDPHLTKLTHLPPAAQPFVVAVHADDGRGFAGGWIRDEIVWAAMERLPRHFDGGDGRLYELTTTPGGEAGATRLLTTADGRRYLAPLVLVIERRHGPRRVDPTAHSRRRLLRPV